MGDLLRGLYIGILKNKHYIESCCQEPDGSIVVTLRMSSDTSSEDYYWKYSYLLITGGGGWARECLRIPAEDKE